MACTKIAPIEKYFVKKNSQTQFCCLYVIVPTVKFLLPARLPQRLRFPRYGPTIGHISKLCKSYFNNSAKNDIHTLYTVQEKVPSLATHGKNCEKIARREAFRVL